MIEAVLFDMDGVLVDSEELIFLAAKQMFAEHDIKVTRDDFKPFIGTGEDSYLGNVAKKYGYEMDVARDKARTYRIYEQLAPGRLELLPGVNDFINRCKKRQLKLAVATSADLEKMNVNLQVTRLKSGIFDATVNGLEVNNKKPHPEIYLKAAEKLLVKPSACLVVEDAVSGVEAAKAAGAKCLAVATSFSRDDLLKADWIVENLTEAPEDALIW